MRALTLHQPWASLIAVGAKTIETRGRRTSYRGPLLIHAGKAIPDPMLLEGFWPLLTDEQNLVVDDLTLGAVVASCQLIDCVEIGGPTTFSTGIVEGEEPETAGMDVIVHHPALGILDECLILDRWHGGCEDVSDQLPFGDFSPGRYAWLLDDVKSTTKRCPRCWGEGTLPPEDWPCDLCSLPEDTIRGSGFCTPVPMRGRQGLWIPTADDWTCRA